MVKVEITITDDNGNSGTVSLATHESASFAAGVMAAEFMADKLMDCQTALDEMIEMAQFDVDQDTSSHFSG